MGKLRLPKEHLIASSRAMGQAVVDARLHAAEYSVSTGVLLALLGRWATSLKQALAQERAKQLLHCLLWTLFHEVAECVFCCPLEPQSVYIPGAPLPKAHVELHVVCGQVLFEPLLAHVRGLRSLKRKQGEEPDGPLSMHLGDFSGCPYEDG